MDQIIIPDHHKNIITRGLLKTSQVIEYRVGDDGTYEAGWWKGRLNANNKTRFIAKTIAGDDVVIDRATGLMWAADGSAAGCNNGAIIAWNNAIDYALALDFAGFTDWRMPNINELLSITDYTKNNPAILEDPPFENTHNFPYWSSTAYIIVPNRAWILDYVIGEITTKAKTDTTFLRCVRGGI